MIIFIVYGFNFDDEQIDSKKNDNFDYQSAGVLSDYYDYINAKKIQIDKEFYPYSKQKSINVDKKLLCSIQEIKKDIIINFMEMNSNLLQHQIQHIPMEIIDENFIKLKRQ